MRSSIPAALAAGALLATACGGGSRPVQINPQEQVIGSRWNATLATPAGLTGVTQIRGTGWMAADPRDPVRTKMSVELENAVPGGEHPWHVHVGQCGSNGQILDDAKAYSPLQVGDNGKAAATADLAMRMPRTGQYYINVHASRNNMGTIIACGNLAPPIR
jgi:hypothetical protein